jgi:hypothetical protein
VSQHHLGCQAEPPRGREKEANNDGPTARIHVDRRHVRESRFDGNLTNVKNRRVRDPGGFIDSYSRGRFRRPRFRFPGPDSSPPESRVVAGPDPRLGSSGR